jgi:repressor LexA
VAPNLSDNQARIYAFIQDYTRRQGRPPTNREIGEAVGINSTGHVDYHLSVLEKKGWILRERKTSRGIRLVQQDQRRGLPILGTIAAGQPLEIAEQTDDMPRLDLATHEREYVLRVRGDSMIGDHINDGDCVLIDREAYIGDGDIIVATRKSDNQAGAATLKRIYREAKQVRLQPANSAIDPILVDAETWDREWEVQGKVTAVYRRC